MFNVLLVDDDEMDVLSARRAWKRLGLAHPLVVARDGEECLEYLSQRQSEGREPPGLVLMDIRMPRADGLETLERLRSSEDPRLRSIPVVMLTSSRAASDRRASHDRGANAYLVKPLGFQELCELLAATVAFWSQVERG